MELPKTDKGNKYAIVFMDFFSKWLFVFPAPDQKSLRIARLLAGEIVPFCGVPEALLTDRGTNLLSHLMLDLCELLGTKKLNTTAYHPECDGMGERFNRTLKTMIRKHVDKFGDRWDDFLPGVLWAYRNTPHESSGEKPSFLLFGVDCRSPTAAALLPSSSPKSTEVSDYREELMWSLSSARSLAAKSIQQAQVKYKAQYDKKFKGHSFKAGEWILIRFPQDESGRRRKLSRPWRGPFRIVSCRGPDVVATKVYFPEDGEIQVHQSRVCACPAGFPTGYFWYGGRRRGPGRPPKWVEKLLEGSDNVGGSPDNSASPNVDEQETADGSDSFSQDVKEPDTADESDSDDEDDPIVQESPGLDVPKTRTRTRTINPPERYM